MTTFLFTSPATNVRTGQRGTLVLTDHDHRAPTDRRGSALILTGSPAQTILHGAHSNGAVHLVDVESLEITSAMPSAQVWDPHPASTVFLHLKDGSTVGYRLSHSSPVLLREIFTEAGWSGLCRKRTHRSMAVPADLTALNTKDDRQLAS